MKLAWKKKLTTGAAALGLIVAFGVTDVVACVTTPAVGDCPKKWSINLLSFPVTPTVGNTHDQNEDGWVCIKANNGLKKKNEGTTLVVKDNTNPEQPPQ